MSTSSQEKRGGKLNCNLNYFSLLHGGLCSVSVVDLEFEDGQIKITEFLY